MRASESLGSERDTSHEFQEGGNVCPPPTRKSTHVSRSSGDPSGYISGSHNPSRYANRVVDLRTTGRPAGRPTLGNHPGPAASKDSRNLTSAYSTFSLPRSLTADADAPQTAASMAGRTWRRRRRRRRREEEEEALNLLLVSGAASVAGRRLRSSVVFNCSV